MIRDYLAVTRSIDIRELERARMRQVSMGIVPNPDTIADGIVYVALQELATRISHRNTGKLLNDPAGPRDHEPRRGRREPAPPLLPRPRLGRARDRPVGHGRGDRAPGALRSRCPAPASKTSRRTHASIADAGVYDFASHHDQILVPVVFKHWRIEQLQNLKSAAEQARERLVKHVEKVGNVAKRMKSRLAPRPAAIV